MVRVLPLRVVLVPEATQFLSRNALIEPLPQQPPSQPMQFDQNRRPSFGLSICLELTTLSTR